MKVLIAEDELISLKMLASILPVWGYEVVAVANGEEAWEILQRPDAPRLAIFDWMMPGIDGIDLTRLVRDQLAHRYTYIFLITSRDSRADLVRGLEAGADDYLAKPFDPQELRVRLNSSRRAILAQDQLETLAKELARKNQKLGELTNTAHRFVDDVSHEFRTPLTVIKEFTSIIADGLGGPVTEPQREYLGTITQAVHDLAQMVDDLLDSSKLKSGTLRVDRRAQPLAEIMDNAMMLVASKARAKDIELVTKFDSDGHEVFVDRDKCVRSLVNLLVNAIKFSPAGRPVTVSVAEEDGDVEIAVTDQGPGLTQEQLDVIFERFRQVGCGGETASKGVGIGLSIVRELTWLNLGAIRVASQPGAGSRFAFTVPTSDPAIVASRFLERLSEIESPRERVACLRITARGRTDVVPELRGFATDSCYPTDLVIDGPDGRGVLAIGLTDSVDDWRDRLLRLRSRAMEESPGEHIAPVEITCEGDWAFPREAHEVTSLLCERHSGSVARA